MFNIMFSIEIQFQEMFAVQIYRDTIIENWTTPNANANASLC